MTSGAAGACGYDDEGRPSPGVCMSRHFGNEGKPRPPVAWEIAYACVRRPGNDPLRQPACDQALAAYVCDACASSLVDGRQRCARCLAPMRVSHLSLVTAPASGPTP